MDSCFLPIRKWEAYLLKSTILGLGMVALDFDEE